jgi:hypothetical protein
MTRCFSKIIVCPQKEEKISERTSINPLINRDIGSRLRQVFLLFLLEQILPNIQKRKILSCLLLLKEVESLK